MSKNGSKSKFFLTKKSETNRIIYPNLKPKTSSTYKSFLSPSTNSMNRRKKLNRTSSGFLDRNYNTFIKKIMQGKNFINTSMIQEHKLNSMLYKLREYYNELNTYNKQHFQKIKDMLNTIKDNEERLEKMKELQTIDLPDEKIGIKNYDSLKLTKEEIETKMFALLNQKKEIEDLMNNEQEYNKTLEYMLEAEETQLFNTKTESLAVIEKISNIKRYQKIVNDNISQFDKKEKGYNILKRKIFNDIKLVQKINSNQEATNEKLKDEIKRKEVEIKNLEEKIQKLKDYENVDAQESKEELKEKIKNAKEFEQKRLKDEKRCIDIINCLTILQKYFHEDDIDNDNFEKDKLMNSKEYQQILQLNQEENNIFKSESRRYIKEDVKNNEEKEKDNINNRNQMNSMFYSTFNNKKFFDSNNSIKSRENMTISATFRNRKKFQDEKRFKKLGNKTSSTFYQTRYDFNSFYNNDNNSLNELIMKFNSINITKEEVFKYINNLLSKLDFYRKQMNYIHNKEINLEVMKTKYNIEVQNIITNNFFNFEELTKNNQKCKKFLEENEYFMNKMKKINQKIKMEKILKSIEQNEEIEKDENEELILDEINNTNEDDININGDNILFKLSKDLIINIKNFFIGCSDFLKEIYITITNNKKFKINNIENDTCKNPFIIVLKKLHEYDKNKDIIISDDYKLLLQYIKNLIKFCKDHKHVLSQEMLDDVISNLINKFYKPGEVNKRLDKVFINRFLAKKNPNYNNIFVHFTSLSDQVIENVKAIYDLINSEEKKLYLKEKEGNKNLVNTNSENQNQINDDESKNDTIKSKKIKYKKRGSVKSVNLNSNSTNNISSNIFAELSEDKENIDEINSSGKKVINIKRRWKIKSLDKRITNKLYNPFLEKTAYLRQINPNIPGIKHMTSRTSKASHQINKKIGEVDIISHQMNIYNNPNLNTNQLCDNTYNSLVKLVYNSTKRNNMRSGKFRYFFDK